MAREIFDVQELSFHYADTPVLRSVNMQVFEGDFIALLGSNGAGKSTLLRLLLGELPARSGQIRLFGQDISKFKEWNQVQYIAQRNDDFNPDFPASVLEVVVANLYKKIPMFRPFRRSDYQKAREALSLCNVEHLENKRIGELSGGQMQRVFLARALVNEAKVLIMDEATSGIDSHSEHLIYDLLQKLREEEKLTVIMVTHDLGQAMKQGSRLLALGQDGIFEFPVEDAMNPVFLSKLYGYSGDKVQ